jgi:hypothetical protein
MASWSVANRTADSLGVESASFPLHFIYSFACASQAVATMSFLGISMRKVQPGGGFLLALPKQFFPQNILTRHHIKA